MLPVLFTVLAALIGLQVWRWSDLRHDARVWNQLANKARGPTAIFVPALVDGLPAPVRRYFTFVIRTGTPLWSVARIRMHGEIGLGNQEAPNYLPMHAKEILAPPHGLVWKLTAGRGALRIAGSDGCFDKASWVRFWLLKILPIVRAGGSHDHARAAFGRVVAEAVFWVPAALLPAVGVSWDAVDDSIVRVTVRRNGMVQSADITIAEDGRPIMVVIPRWSDANPDKVFQLQPFGGYLSDFQEFGGYRLPTVVEGGNFIGSDDYFPFYKVTVTDIRFVGDDQAGHSVDLANAGKKT